MLVAIVVLGLAFAFRPQAVIVDMVTVDHGEFVITVNAVNASPVAEDQGLATLEDTVVSGVLAVWQTSTNVST